MKKIVALLFILVLTVLAIYNNQKTTTGSPDQVAKVGFSAPYFTLQAFDNNQYKVSGKREKPVILNFWASWCGPCRQEAPDLKEIYLKYQDKLDFYAINLTSSDDVDSAKAFVQEFQLSFPILLDKTGEVADAYRVMSIPTTYFIDTDGIIQHKLIGAADKGSFEQYVKELIK